MIEDEIIIGYPAYELTRNFGSDSGYDDPTEGLTADEIYGEITSGFGLPTFGILPND